MDNELIDRSSKFTHQLGYAIGHILNDVCASLWFTYFLVFFHLVLEFSASQAGYLMMIGQVIDALSTPFVGYHSDRTENPLSIRYGRRKLWHLFGTICVLSSFPFIFSECIGCSMTHKWAQMFYFSSFIMIFQIGWASVQISHLSLIPELSSDEHIRTHLTAVRFGFTVFSNLFVYIVTWLILRMNGAYDKEQVGPTDLWKFKEIVYIVLSVGAVASILFHIIVKERSHIRREQFVECESSLTHYDFLRRPVLYQVASVYMSTRLVVNVSQVLIPLYLHRTLGLPAIALAAIPLAMYIGSLLAAGVQRLAPRSFTRKFTYLAGTVCVVAAFCWIYIDSDEIYKAYLIYVVAVLIGFGGAVMLITSLALTADLVGGSTDASAFVYGLMSFTDKLACGIAIVIIQNYADGAAPSYYRDVLSWVCGSASVVGLVGIMLMPKLTPEVLLSPEVLVSEDNPSLNSVDCL